MWGNAKGWTIAAILFALSCAWLYILTHMSATTAPTAFSADADHFAAIALPAPPAALLASDNAPNNAAPDDASALYRRAMSEYADHPGLYENFAALGTLSSPTAVKLEAIDLLVKASPTRDVKLFATHPEDLFKFSHTKPPLDALRTLGRVCVDRLALLNQKAGNTNDAIKYYKAGFALGWDLCKERLTYDEFSLGEEIVSKSCAGLASVLDKTGEPAAADVRAFAAQQAAEFQRHVDPILPIVRSVDAKVVGPHTGDIFELAKRSRERMWRIEAILALGRIRYFAGDAGTSANQRTATQFLRKVADDDADEIARRAAAIARDLTIEDYRTQ